MTRTFKTNVLGLVVAAVVAEPALACAVAWTPPPYAEALRQQRENRANAEWIALARVVEGRFEDGSTELFFDTVVRLDDDAQPGGLEFVSWRPCRPELTPGTLVLVYYDRLHLRDPDDPASPPRIDIRPGAVVRLTENVDPDIGPLLRAAAARLRTRAEKLRNRTP